MTRLAHWRKISLSAAPLILLIVGLMVLAGCSDAEDPSLEIDLQERVSIEEANAALSGSARADGVYLFGFDLRSTPEEDARQYTPFLRYLEETTGLKFKLRFSMKDQNVGAELASGRIHFAAIGAVTYIEGREQAPIRPLVRGVNLEGLAEYRSFIVVPVDSPMKRLSDLRDRRLAFGNIDSTQGHLIPKIMLEKAGIRLDELGTHFFTGSHFNCASAVIEGRADACGMQDTLAQILADEGKLRILARSEYYPSSGIAAGPRVPEDVVNRVRAALLAFEPTGAHRRLLYHWDRTEMPLGFVAAEDADYAPLRDWMERVGF